MDPHALCLALNMFFEARDQDFEGMMMVADVTIERVEDKRFPDTICGVVWQRKQFSWTHDGLPDKPDTSTHHDEQAWALAQDIAESVIEGGVSLPSSGATHYHATSVQPYWADAYEKIGMVGDHVFYIWQ